MPLIKVDANSQYTQSYNAVIRLESVGKVCRKCIRWFLRILNESTRSQRQNVPCDQKSKLRTDKM